MSHHSIEGTQSSAQGERSARERVVGDAPVRHHAAAQPNLCALAATPQTTRLPPLVAAEAHSDPPHRRLSGIEPQQPDAPKTTASAADHTLPPRCRSRPATLPPPQGAYQLQLCRARRATSPRFPISPALAHQHPRHPARICRNQSFSIIWALLGTPTFIGVLDLAVAACVRCAVYVCCPGATDAIY